MSFGFIAAGLAAVSIAATVHSSQEAAKAQEEAAKQAAAMAKLNASAAESENIEELRREEREQASSESLARAKAAASGVDIFSGSTGGYLEDMETENDLQLDWLRRSGMSEVGIIKAGGESAYKTGMASASATKTAGYTSAIKQAASLAGSAVKTPTADTS